MSCSCQNHDIVSKKFKNDKYAAEFGIELDEITDSSIRMHMKITDKLLNFYGKPHGGAIYSLADAAFSVIANSENNISVAIDCNITYHNAVNVGETLYCHGHTLSVSKKIGCYLFELYTLKGDQKTSVATMKGTAYRTGHEIEPAAK